MQEYGEETLVNFTRQLGAVVEEDSQIGGANYIAEKKIFLW